MSRQGSHASNGSEKCICQICECGNHRCPHENNGRLIGTDGVPFESTEYGSRYVHKDAQRQRAERPLHTSLGQQGEMEKSTTHLADYQEWGGGNRRSTAFRPSNSYSGPIGAFNDETTHHSDFTGKKGEFIRATRPTSTDRRDYSAFDHQTTNRVDFTGKNAERMRAARPESILYRSNQPFNETTTQQQDYRVFDGVHRQRTSYRPATSRYLSDAPFDATTENREKFRGQKGEFNRVTRPVVEIERNPEPLDGNTTYRLGYTHKQTEKAQNQRPHEERVAPTGKFDDLTTHKVDFQEKPANNTRNCPADVALNHLKHSRFRNVGKKNGHLFYKETLPSANGRNRELTQIVG
ncbi:hypothetical protein M3Y95_01187200 [Aphelenchoides besseyi]|nr:hypothetical protein M3Y95_01187200 [Aphelenchoides besseyi]